MFGKSFLFRSFCNFIFNSESPAIALRSRSEVKIVESWVLESSKQSSIVLSEFPTSNPVSHNLYRIFSAIFFASSILGFS